MKTQTFKLTGLTCTACKKVSEKRIGSLSGVTKVDVNVGTGVTTIEVDKEISPLSIKEVLKDTPYGVLEE